MSDQPETHDADCEMYSEGCGCESREKLKKERDALRALLRYWLPDETMIPTGHEAKWNESVAAIDAAREGVEMSDQPEALRLANALTECHHIGVGGPDLQAAALLRRQHAEIESLKAECDALRADAERYRWLRVRNEDGVDPSGPFVVIGDDGNVDYPSGAEIDAAIAAARGGK